MIYFPRKLFAVHFYNQSSRRFPCFQELSFLFFTTKLAMVKNQNYTDTHTHTHIYIYIYIYIERERERERERESIDH